MKKLLYDVYCRFIAKSNFLPSYYRQKARNFYWVFVFLFSRFYFVRKIALLFYKADSFPNYNLNNSIFEQTDLQQIVDTLNQEGFYQGLQIPPQYVDQILDFAFINDCYAEGNINQGFRFEQYLEKKAIYPNNIMRGEYSNTFDNCAAIQTISQDPLILAIAEAYLQSKPILMNTRLWWNLIVNDNECDLRKGARAFHYDPDDYGSIAFAFYITDVDLQSSGTHVCVRGSHKKKKIQRLLSLSLNSSDAAIIKDYGQKNIVDIKGKSGYGFIEDRFIFHKANSPLNRERLILYIQFGINDYRKFRVKPTLSGVRS